MSAAKPKLLTSSVNPAVAGERVTFTAKPPTGKAYTKLKASQKRKATLVLQRRDGKAWREVARAKVGTKKKVTFAQVVPAKAAGTVKYRVRTKVGKKTYAAGSLTLKVVAQRLAVARNTTDADRDITYTNTLTPARKGARSPRSATSTAPGAPWPPPRQRGRTWRSRWRPSATRPGTGCGLRRSTASPPRSVRLCAPP